MLTIEIICVGKLNQSFLADGCAEYVKRLMPFTKILLTELPEEKLQSSNRGAEMQVIEKESDRILARLAKTRAHCAALCVEGEQKSSEELAQYLEKVSMNFSHLTFVIGGSLGLSQKLKESADIRLSMSKMTFPHQLARLMLLEQLYRAVTINENIKYHK